MCGRYSLAPAEFSQLRLQFRVEAQIELIPRYNVAPTWSPGHEPPIILQAEPGGRQLALARWWMIPAGWQRPLRALPAAFNARSEELANKPFWSKSFEARRCLVPATGWREFNGPRSERRAFQFHYEHALFAFAGLWDLWRSPDGDEVRSFAIVTVAATDMVRPIHDRMPLVVDPAFHELWLDPGVGGERALAQVRPPPQPLAHYEADTWGNDSRREGPECIAPARRSQLGLFGS
jgi:putative SOS response-associated peptidase YedK